MNNTDSVPLYQVLDEEGTIHLKDKQDIDTKILIRIMEGMLRIRILDERMLKLQRQGRIGFYGPASGQEAAIIGSAMALLPDDWVFPALRETGVAFIRGFPLADFLNQVYGNRDDLLKGRQMPCHPCDRRINHVSWSSCIGNQLPQAVGAAIAARQLGHSIAVIAYLGDGATSEGDFHWAANFAGVFRAPVVFFCQNNQWAISVPVSKQTESPSLSVKARAYGFPGIRVDGNDPLAVYLVTFKALDRARQGKGPTLIEALTYRMAAHSTSDDPTRYRDKAEVEIWSRRDPLIRFRSYLESLGLWNAERETLTRTRFEKELQETLTQAESIPPPHPETLFSDVYSSIPWHIDEQKKELLDYLREKSHWNP